MIAEAAVRAGVRDIELSKSVAKAPIPSKCRKRIVDIPRFYSRPIPARGAFATDLDTPPPRTVSGAPPAPVGLLAHRFTRVRYALFPLLRPLTLHCTRKRGAAEGEGAQQTRRGAPERPRKVIRRASGRISGRRYCEGCSGSGSERVPRVWCEVLSRAPGRGAGRDGPPGSPPGAPGGVGRGGIGGPVVGGGPGGAGAVPAPPLPLRPDGASRMVGRRLACRDAAGPVGPLACGWTTCVPLDHRIS